MADQLCSAPLCSIGAAMLKMLMVSPQARMMLTQQIFCRENRQYWVDCESMAGRPCLRRMIFQTAALMLHCSIVPTLCSKS
jgi:hypothetical protein